MTEAIYAAAAGPCGAGEAVAVQEDREACSAMLRSWVMRELAPWLLTGVDWEESDDLFSRLNDSHSWIGVYRFTSGEVSLAPKPEGFHWEPGHELRASMYLNFFQQVAKVLPPDFHTTMSLNLDDRRPEISGLPVFSFQKKRGAKNPLLPDIDFLGFDYDDPRFVDTVAYEEKLPKAVFSGSTTGGEITETIARTLALPRLRAANYFEGNDCVDFRLPNIGQVTSPEAQAVLESMPFCRKPRLDWRDQFLYRFILSIDGNGATCSRVVIALMSNSVLLKYDSDEVLYYFGGMQPWVHYVPVRRNSDVEAIIDIETRDPAPFAGIAAAGKRFAATYLNRRAVIEYTRLLLLLYRECLSERARPRTRDPRVAGLRPHAERG